MPGGEALKRVAIVVSALDGGGGVPAVARFIKDAALSSGRFTVQMISLCMSSRDETSVELRRPASWRQGVGYRQGVWEGLSFTHVGAVLGEFEFQRYRRRCALSNVLKDCDLIQVVSGSPAWANAVVGLGKPVALQVATRAKIERRMRDEAPHSPVHWWRKVMTEITDRMDDRALRRVDAIQVENPWMLEYARQINGHRPVDLRYAPPGVDAKRFRPLPTRNLDGDPYILCVGRLDDPRKNVGLLLETYARLPTSIRTATRLVLAGSSPPTESFWQRANEWGLADQICYVARPSQEELIALYQNASVFALPSDEEGLGIVILEAMACAIPVVSTRSGGPDGIIKDDDDGFLTPLNDAEAMANRIETLLNDPQRNIAMGDKARITIESRYDERVTGAVFLEMWDRLLSTSSSSREDSNGIIAFSKS